MASLVTQKEEIVTVNFVVGVNSADKIFVAKDEKDFKEPMKVVDRHWVTFRLPRYRDNVEILSKTFKIVDISGAQIDPALLRYERFCSLVKDWSLVGEDGNKLPVGRDSIDNLIPDVANQIIQQLDEVLS